MRTTDIFINGLGVFLPPVTDIRRAAEQGLYQPDDIELHELGGGSAGKPWRKAPGRRCGLDMDETTPLLRLGILNSLKTAILMNYLRDELNISIPVDQPSAENFETVTSIVSLIEVVTQPSQ